MNRSLFGFPKGRLRDVLSTVKSQIGFWKEYDMGVYVVSTTYTQAHGLARYPAGIQAFIENTTTDLGWAVGDRIDINSLVDGGAANQRAAVGMNTTNAYVVTGTGTPNVFNKSTSAQSSITAASWKVIIRVYE